MPNHEAILCDLDEARGRIDAAREALHQSLQGFDQKDPALVPVRQLMAKLKRMAAEVASVEETIAAREGVAV